MRGSAGRRILITGGAGYVGSVLVGVLLERGCRVDVVDNLMYSQLGLLQHFASGRFHFVRGDVRDRSLIADLASRADAIIPLAALVGMPVCRRNPALAREVNTGAVRILLEVRSRSQPIVFPSTTSGYGTTTGEELCDEDSPLQPISEYGRTKVDAERMLLDDGEVIVLRPATVFGTSPRMRIDLLVNDFTWRAYHDRSIVVFEKDFKRNFVHVRDLADCFVHCLENFETMKDRPYNVGLFAANLSKAQLAARIAEQVPGLSIHYAEVGSDPDRRNCIISTQRIERTGFVARRNLDDGIRELLAAYELIGRQWLGNA